MTNLKSNMRAHTHTLWVRRQPPKYLTQSNRTTSRTSYSAQFTTCYLFFGNNIWGTCHKLRVAFNGCFSAYEYFPSVLFLFLCFLFFICFFFGFCVWVRVHLLFISFKLPCGWPPCHNMAVHHIETVRFTIEYSLRALFGCSTILS